MMLKSVVRIRRKKPTRPLELHEVTLQPAMNAEQGEEAVDLIFEFVNAKKTSGRTIRFGFGDSPKDVAVALTNLAKSFSELEE